MTNNCVSVSLAKLLAYRNIYELWNDVYGSALSDVQYDCAASHTTASELTCGNRAQVM
jgi:hypothetical protein